MSSLMGLVTRVGSLMAVSFKVCECFSEKHAPCQKVPGERKNATILYLTMHLRLFRQTALFAA